MNKDDLKFVHAYQAILRAEIAAIRGLLPNSIKKLDAIDGIELLVSSPKSGGGIHNPEARLSICEVLQAIAAGLDEYYKNIGADAKPNPDDIVKTFIDLAKKGLLIPFPSRDNTPITQCSDNRLLSEAINKLEDYYLSLEYKTFHGEISRLAANASPLPSKYEVSGFLMLPLVEEPLPSLIYGIPPSLEKWLVSKCGDEGRSLLEHLWASLKEVKYESLNSYQYSVIEEYFSKKLRGENPDAVLAAPTGGGKTLAFVIIILAETIAAKCLGERRPTAILAYPRKTLARDQLEDIAAIVYYLNRRLPPYMNIVIWIRDGNSPVESCPPNASGCVALKNTWEKLRGVQLPGHREARHRYNREEKVYESDPPWIIDVKESVSVKTLEGFASKPKPKPNEISDIIITNYDMIFKESIICLRTNLVNCSGLGESLLNAKLIVLDEAHTVLGGKNAVKAQALFIALEAAGRKPSTLVSSATLLERKLIDPTSFLINTVSIRIHKGNEKSDAEEVFETLTGWRPSSLVYVDYYEVSSRRPKVWKLSMWTILYPSILRRPLTAFGEALVSLMHALAAQRDENFGYIKNAKAIAFIEYKTSLRDSARYLVKRIILEAGDVHDRVLLTSTFNKSIINLDKLLKSWNLSLDIDDRGSRIKAIQDIEFFINNLINQGISKPIQILWHEYFTRFHAVAPYTRPDDYSSVGKMHASISSVNDFEKLIIDIIRRLNINKLNKFNIGTDTWLDSLLVQAAIMSASEPWQENNNLLNYVNLAKSIGADPGFPIVFHHGDYTGEARLEADELVTKGDPLLIKATSTLEVGLNVKDVVVTMHYILPREPGRIIQMVGRSGRSTSTMHISFGIAVLRHNAWESPKKTEFRAVRYFHEARAPPTPKIKEDPFLLARLCITIDPDSPQNGCKILRRASIPQNVMNIAIRICEEREQTISTLQKGPLNYDMCSPGDLKILGIIRQSPLPKIISDAIDILINACKSSNPTIVLASAETLETIIINNLKMLYMTGSSVPNTLHNILNIVIRIKTAAYYKLAETICSVARCTVNGVITDLVTPKGFLRAQSLPSIEEEGGPDGIVYIV